MATTDLVLTVRRPAGGARTHRFATGPVSVGRAPRSDVRLDDPRISGVHLRFLQARGRWVVLDPGSSQGATLNGGPLPENTPRPLQSGDALALGDFVIDVALDEGGGLTTDSRDTDSVARSLVTHARGAGGWGLWVLDGASVGAQAGVQRGRTLLIGSDADCDLVLRDARVAARHASVRFERDGALALTAHAGGVSVRGQRVRKAVLWPEDIVRIEGVSLRVRGPVAAGEASGGLSRVEGLAILVILGSAAAMLWAWLGG